MDVSSEPPAAPSGLSGAGGGLSSETPTIGTTSTAPLYRKDHADASVLAVSVPTLQRWLLHAPADAQLAWLHQLNVRIDAVLERVPATKVALTGNSMLFVSGAENGDADHVATLVRLADELDALGRGGGPSTGSGSSSRSSGDTGGSAGCGGTPPTTPLRLPGGQPLRFQMGLHAGPVATGILGTAALRYGVYGPTVTLARALEAASAPGVLRASDAAVRRLGGVAGAAPGSGSGSAAGLPSSAGPLEAAAAAAAAAGWLDGGDLVVAVGGDALRAAAGCAALAAAAAAGGSSGGGGWPSLDPAALLSYALLGMAAPILLQAGTGRAAMRRMLSQLTA